MEKIMSGYYFMTEIMSTEVRENIAKVAKNPGIIQKWLESAVPKAISLLVQVVLAIVFVIIGLKVIGFIVKLCRRSFEKSKMEAGVVTFLSSLIRYVLYFLLFMLVLGQLGVTTGSVVAVLGSAGLTLGLAMQGSLSNFAGGVLILILKPFVVGDYILAEGYEGTVVSITVFYTKMMTLDNKAVTIPNGILSNSVVTNYSNMEKRMIRFPVGVDYDSDLSKVRTVLQQMAEQDGRVVKEDGVQVIVVELAESSVNMEVRLWVKTEDYWQVKWDLTEWIKQALDENQIKIPYPHMEIVKES